MSGAANRRCPEDYELESWGDEENVSALPSFDYWNDPALEHAKAFDVRDGDFDKLTRYVQSRGLLHQFNLLESMLDGPIVGRGASLAAGVCWLEAEILRTRPKVKSIHCVEFSRHRLFDLAPRVLAHYDIDPGRVTLCLGSFYTLKLAPASLDFVILCQAFHHAHDPVALLAEMKKVLKPGGVVILSGEHFHPWWRVAFQTVKHFARLILNRKGYRTLSPFIPTWSTLFAASLKKGDRQYSLKEYRQLFSQAGFSFRRLVARSAGQQGFVLMFSENRRP